MAQISFEQAEQISNEFNQQRNNNQNNNNQNGPQVGFFKLANDGDEAIVRFLHDTTSSFDLITVHEENVNGKKRKINCIRDAHEPIDRCPLCRKGGNTSTRFFIHLLEYKYDEKGNIYCEPKIWERSLEYATKLRDLINEYGPLSQCLFKVKRSGIAGSVDTKYSIMYAAPQVYPPESFPNRAELFGDYKVVGTVVMDKTAEELNEFITTGSFPQRQRAVSQAQQTESLNNPYNAPSTSGPQGQITLDQQPPQRAAAWGQQANNNANVTTNPTRYY